jgi:2-amino-4-hydroxy-6-hydroxymethyldihydropteridine diphosphokinase
MKTTGVFLALGSNIGEREKNLAAASAALRDCPDIEIVRESSVYETAPKYKTEQPDFLNMVVEISTDLEPRQLLTFCKHTEKKLGREQSLIRNGPRIIDLDILFYNDKLVNLPELKIPHPGLYERRFVLIPLDEIAPGFICPQTGQTVMELMRQCSDNGRIERLGRLYELMTSSISTGVI